MKVKIGEIFEVILDGEKKGYLQYVGDDKTQLGSEVVGVFAGRFPVKEQIPLEMILQSGIEFHAHVTSVRLGEKLGIWKPIDNNAKIGSEKKILFRDPVDPLERRENGRYGLPRVSESWHVWEMNKPKMYEKPLGLNSLNAEPGFIVNPIDIVDRMQSGQYLGFYPDYK